MTASVSLKIYCDAAVLGNPGGPGGWGFVAIVGSNMFHRAHGPIYKRSNNEAEYQAIVRALTWLKENESQHASAIIYSDSKLAVNQINGQWGCRADHLARLREECVRLVDQLSFRVSVEWLPREENIEADLEAARGVAEALGVEEEEALFVLAAQSRKYRFLKANEKAKKLLFDRGLITNLITYDKRKKQRIAHIGIPFGAMNLRQRNQK